MHILTLLSVFLLNILPVLATPVAGLVDLTSNPLLGGLLSLVGNVGNAPPPKLLWTPRPSPECAAVNGGELQCCRGTLAGDQPLVVFLAAVYGYKLNPNDINGLVCK
ncbi:hypothetical protein JX266_004552 [Neoarthrinium moseri]|uniref:uncharacterized protein n=1 Tax=Neoarthrinium moseri TaxID=1658444 RepID=UPI001FDBBE9C|nr:uncharacterized protein JN550_006512 [Neoarthrinium moseri]KAI1849603.1 hypothetical protein JX266_004552 [Neoarthrinium moseri]KAI1868024.1 hypothetical protein JN550_006512 [Neoarthrinium moseri]